MMFGLSACKRSVVAVLAIACLVGVSGCGGWRGLNSLPLPGTVGGGPGSFTVQAQLPDITNLEENSRVRVGDVTVGNITKVERQGWHALVTMQLAGDVDLPENATAKLGQTSLLGSLHIELEPPTDAPPRGKLHQGSLIPLSSAGKYPTTEETLGAASLLLNGGGLGQLQDITKALSTAFNGREQDLRSLLDQLERFVRYVNDQTGDIITATEKLNGLVGQFAASDPILERTLKTLPDALAVLRDNRTELADALDRLGKFTDITADAVDGIKDNLVTELNQLGPVLESLANAGPALTRSLSMLATFPWPNETLHKWCRGDFCNLTAIFDLTLSRLDAGLFTGTRWEGNLTELEMQWGRTIGQMPSPYTAGNPLIVPYRFDQGP
jgi:phospholipid/cholesterol/gamma-HCH transport system substrate-binding protein